MFLPRFAKELGVVVWLSGFGAGVCSSDQESSPLAVLE